ncbi:cyclic nucleotide-binding domain-containing protein [Ralstonia edaphi]|uniref:cyclic nucleotide-binding domain-containing protein n=1 Tax=Ralstonia edaphi TaxID=3058599 RepID=UPI00292F7B1F|nr:cyclic nucleotide-binding domain-containing protein [Ralstonia sp. LMG 6871]
MNAREAALIEEIAHRKIRVKKGEAIFRAGDPLEDIYAVKYGTFKLTLGTPEGREMIAAFYLSGNIFGTDGFESDARTSTATALEDSEVCAVSWKRLAELAQQEGAIQQLVTQIFSARIGRKQRLMLCIGSMRAEERVAMFLLDLSERLRERGFSSRHIILRMSREDIAEHLAMQIETVSRIFSLLAREGILRVEHREIQILDFQALETVAHADGPRSRAL